MAWYYDRDHYELELKRIWCRKWLYLCREESLAEAEWKAEEVFDTGWSMQENYPVQDWKIGHRWTRSFNCNWKTFWDNFAECLHCPTVHPALVKLVPIFKRGLMEERDHPDHARVARVLPTGPESMELQVEWWGHAGVTSARNTLFCAGT